VDREEGTAGRFALQIDNHRCELPEEAQQLAAEISQDLGGVPDSYLAAAVGIAGGALSRETGPTATSAEVLPVTMAVRYDEWDYRRRGYRKDWCTVHEKEVTPVQSTFVAATRKTYRGELTRLRHQFEMMRINECFVGRQKEGDELDLDAAVEARADRQAGTAASDNLFVRLVRNERDLVTLFLVDMSNSTQGWVGKVIKEALVLLCEAMEAAGDRYGMYGFSGMRRSRCEVFPIKRLDEPYREAVARRIGSIAPRDYTRIGPAIRFGIDRLRRCEARTRLLITITDGKPEDYDDYKGDYAIEDTRKALLEARGSGLHAFGVAVDRQARDYLPRIFGRTNYLVIDQVEQLPMRLTELYRQLTS
jgi:nitric oxide reductase NorD protein